jgi:hypothetical protein
VVVTLWEPAFAAELAAFGTGMPWVAMPPSREGVLATERAQREHASAVADGLGVLVGSAIHPRWADL